MKSAKSALAVKPLPPRGKPASPPWTWGFAGRSLIIEMEQTCWTAGWAPLGGGLCQADAIVNHQVLRDQREATEHPSRYLAALIRELGWIEAGASSAAVAPLAKAAAARPIGKTAIAKRVVAKRAIAAIAMMTGADIRRAAYACARHGDLLVGAWCTAGCSNALRVGDPATVESARPGTINLVVALNRGLTPAALNEALSLATEARVLAVQGAGVLSTRSHKPATGTGTDCIAIAAPVRGTAQAFCGKHTRLGELIGKAALRACARALARSLAAPASQVAQATPASIARKALAGR